MLRVGFREAQLFQNQAGSASAGLAGAEPFELQSALGGCIAIVDGLREVHQRMEMHQAVCPANIRIRDDGSVEFRNDAVISLAYISPEQTGRMNRSVDYRSDYYSLGVLLYQMLAGDLPFPPGDAMEMVHSHIAKPATPPDRLNPAIPPVLAAILLKLLAKNAEDRYQSLEGLRSDLQVCRDALSRGAPAPDFILAQHDVCNRLQLPQTLYGRADETEQLLACFNRVVSGNAECLLVTGYSGIGKSSLINEVHKPMVARRGFFITGKFDQFKRNIPYYAITHAFRELIRQILTLSESRIQEYRSRLLEAFGPNGQLLIDAIPDLQHIVGPQPAVLPLAATEAQNRFNYVVQNFVGVFTRPEHPLVLFLDDLQWADEASLKLIRLLLTSLEHGALLVIGAYRDNEVGASDPLALAIAEIGKQARVGAIAVKPLDSQGVAALVADAVKSTPESVAPLAELIYRRTLGNPFFVGKFIKNLAHEKLLRYADGGWHWDIAEIERLQLTDNVADLLAKEIARLPAATQQLITTAACMGNRFDYRTLAQLTGMAADETKNLLQPALQAGMVMTPDTTFSSAAGASYSYRFLHDRVQQAAYAGNGEQVRKTIHLQIGRLLAAGAQREERLFDIVQQLNAGSELIDSKEEKRNLAELNLEAARKGKATVAYETAFDYATRGAALLDVLGEQPTPLYFSLQLEQMECGFLSRHFAEVERIGAAMLQRAVDDEQRALVYDVLLHSALYQDRHVDGMALALKALRMLGVELPEKAGKLQIILRMLKIRRLLERFTTEQLLGLPREEDRVELLKQRILSRAVSASYVANPSLFPILIFEQIGIILKRGRYTPELPWALAGFAMVLIQGFGAIELGYKLGKLVQALSDKNRTSAQPGSQEVKIGYVTNAAIFHWRQSLMSTVAPFYDNYQAGLLVGEFEYGAYSLVAGLRAELLGGRPLAELLEKMRPAYTKALQLRQKTSSDPIGIFIHTILRLIGTDAEARAQAPQIESDTRLTLFSRHLFDAAAAYLFEEHDAALEDIRRAETYLASASCMVTIPLHHFFHSLTLLALYYGMGDDARAAALAKVKVFQKKLRLWSRHAPMNYLHKWQLVEAERLRILGRSDEALSLYDAAIEGARVNGYVNDEALANELAARFCLEHARKQLARAYLLQSHVLYRQWGALAKAGYIARRHGELLQGFLSAGATPEAAAAPSGEQRLDMDTVIKASHTLSSEIQIDMLLEKLMRLLIENAGAQRGALLLQDEGMLTIQAEIEGDAIRVGLTLPVNESARLSLGVINYVRRTHEPVVLGNAAQDARFEGDPYIVRSGPKSVLCIPLQKQSELVGLLYLENNLAADAFTPQRTELLQILSTQIAISLENATLYNALEQKIAARTQDLSRKNVELEQILQSLKQTQQQLVESAKLASLGELVAGVAHEINTPVGVGVTAASTLAEETDKLGALYQSGAMKRSDLDNYVAIAATVSKLLLSNMDRAATLIQSFKEVAIDQTSEERRQFKLDQYIEEVLLNLSPMLRKGGHEVAVACPEGILLDSYPGALSQVLTNFVTNALMHAFPDGVAGKMAITVTEPDAASVELRFADSGRGIPAEHLTRIFDPFFTTRRGAGGSGLGLNIIYNLVTGALQGYITVESEVGVGTTFILRFPRNLAKVMNSSTS